jgi:hypothetical protein
MEAEGRVEAGYYFKLCNQSYIGFSIIRKIWIKSIDVEETFFFGNLSTIGAGLICRILPFCPPF